MWCCIIWENKRLIKWQHIHARCVCVCVCVFFDVWLCNCATGNLNYRRRDEGTSVLLLAIQWRRRSPTTALGRIQRQKTAAIDFIWAWVCSSSSLRWTPTNKSNCALSSLIWSSEIEDQFLVISPIIFFISVQRRAWRSSRRLNQWFSTGEVSGPTFSFLIMKSRAKFIPQHSQKWKGPPTFK